MRIKKSVTVNVEMDGREAFTVLKALQHYRGFWHDKYGFRWSDSEAQRISREISESLSLDPDKPAAAQAS